MSQGKIVPLIVKAQRDAEVRAHAELRELMDTIDAEIDALERQRAAKMAEIHEKMAQVIAKYEELKGRLEVSA